jgi:hypothetical protein
VITILAIDFVNDSNNDMHSYNEWSRTMTPQIPGYLVAFESTLRPLVAAIALGLIWMGAARMEGPAQLRYTTAGALSVVVIAWLAVAQYLGSANTYFATTENTVPTVLFGLLIPLITAAVGLSLPWIVASQIYRVGGLCSRPKA